MVARTALAWAVAALAVAGCEVDGEIEVTREQGAIVGGLAAELDSAVAAILVGDREVCSGTLIAPSVVLTAAHCLPPHTSFYERDMGVFFGQDFAAADFDHKPIPVGQVTPHPLWVPYLLGYDIGLIRLKQPAPVDPVPLSRAPLRADDVGRDARIVGYGVLSEGGPVEAFRRSGFAIIDDVDAFSLWLTPDAALTCAGDSGGPTLIMRDGVELVAAVHSRSDCETRSIEERVDIHLESFIDPYLAAEGTCEPNRWCPLPCSMGERCDIECDRLSQCERPRVDGDENSGGCAAGGRSDGALAGLVALVVLAVGRRRRRRGAPPD